MFAPPELIETEVFAAVPQNLRKSHVPAERIAAGAGGVPRGQLSRRPVVRPCRQSLYRRHSVRPAFFASRRRASSMLVRRIRRRAQWTEAFIKTGAFSSPTHKHGHHAARSGEAAPSTTLRHALSSASTSKASTIWCSRPKGDLYFTDQGRATWQTRPAAVYRLRAGRRTAKVADCCRARTGSCSTRGRHHCIVAATRAQRGVAPSAGARRHGRHAWACSSRCRAAAAPTA